MNKKLRVLIVEDSEDDAELLLRELRSGGYEPLSERVDTHKAMADALKKKTWDIIITDYSLPHFNGFQALKLLRSSALDIPCIVVSGKIGEDTAVQLMKAGANDYVMKGNLKRLAPAIERELGDAEVRRERKRAEKELQESEEIFRNFMENSPIYVFFKDENIRALRLSKNFEKMLGKPVVELLGKNMSELFPSELAKSMVADDMITLKEGKAITVEEELNGRFYSTTKFPIFIEGKPRYLAGYTTDITERKQAEQALRESEAQYRLLSEHMTDTVWLMDMQLKTTYQSPSAAKLRGFTPQEILELPLEKHATPESNKLAFEALSEEIPRVKADPDYNPIRTLELEYYHKDGTTVWAETKFSVIRDPGGKPESILAEARDITERKQAEQVLQDSEEKYRILFRNASEGIGVAQDGRFKMVNPKLVELLGYTEEEIVTMSLGQFIYPEDREFVIERDMRRLKGEIFENIYQFRAVNKSGDTRWLEINSVLIEWEGRPATIDYYTDITERRGAAILVEKQREEYRTIFDSVRPMIAYLDKEGVIQRINQSGAATVGLEPKEIVGKTMYDFFPAAEADKFAAEDNQVITSGKPALGSITEYTLPSGLKRWAQIDRIPYYNQHGDVTGVITFNQDITGRKLAEDNLEKSYESLKKTLNDTINTMVKIMEIRDPYTAGHQQRVAALATAIALEMKLEDTCIDQLRTASVIHDIGKMYVPSDILSKPGRLSEIEFNLIKTHPQGGYDVVKGMDFPCNVAKAILQHHERLDGSGYPNQLKGEDTLLEAKILSVADVVEAMASHRPYRPSLGIDKALEEISGGKGKIYDPDVVDACMELFSSGRFEFKVV